MMCPTCKSGMLFTYDKNGNGIWRCPKGHGWGFAG